LFKVPEIDGGGGKGKASRETRLLIGMCVALVMMVLLYMWPSVDKRLKASENRLPPRGTPQKPPPDIKRESMAARLKQQQAPSASAVSRSPDDTPAGPNVVAQASPAPKPRQPAQPAAPAAAEKEEPPEEESLADQMKREASEAEIFIPPSDTFTPVEQLDRDILYRLMDVDNQGKLIAPASGHNLKQDRDVYTHVFSFLRTHNLAHLLQPTFRRNDLVLGVRQDEMSVHDVLTRRGKTLATLSEETGLTAAALRAILKRFVQSGLAKFDTKRYKGNPRNDVSLTEKGALVHQALGLDPSTPAEVHARVLPLVEALPLDYVKGRSSTCMPRSWPSSLK
jgi:DNA-binding MarR family transcriptional regulator